MSGVGFVPWFVLATASVCTGFVLWFVLATASVCAVVCTVVCTTTRPQLLETTKLPTPLARFLRWICARFAGPILYNRSIRPESSVVNQKLRVQPRFLSDFLSIHLSFFCYEQTLLREEKSSS